MSTTYPKNPAFHEAGHAVVARDLGVAKGAVRARLIHADRGGGRCEWESRHHARRFDREMLERELAVLVAGSIADYIAAGRGTVGLSAERILRREHSPRRRDGTEAQDAYRWAFEELYAEYRSDDLAHDVLELLAPRALSCAERIVRNKWLQVEMLAKRLEAGHEITI